jgi:spoIIIJ-associated protein
MRFTMTQDSIFEGKTLDDAVRNGLDALGLSRAEVMITVMEEGSSGFLGLGARPYKVRVMPRPGGPPREPGERGRRERGRGRPSAESGARRQGRPDGGRSRDRGRNGRDGVRTSEPRREGAGPHRGGERQAPAPRGDSFVEAGGESRGAPREARDDMGGDDRGRRRRGRRGGRGRSEGRPRPERSPVLGEAGGAPGREPEAPVDAGSFPRAESREPRESREMRESREPREARGPREIREPRDRDEGAGRSDAPLLSNEELASRGLKATEDLLKAMGFEAKVTAQADGENVDVTAEVTEGEELLTGRKGEVRQALQHLLNLTVNRGGGMRYHLQLEINEFWRHREAELLELARSMADEAMNTGQEIVTEYLNAQERRVIHVALREDGRVRTYAIGDGMIKKLAVAPAGQPEAARAED